jgi:hypothetical protein
MATRGPADRMTQRRLAEEPAPPEESDPEPPSPEPGSVPAVETAATPIGKPPLHLEGTSDAELRKRQEAWSEERARHEAYRRARRSEGSEETEARS